MFHGLSRSEKAGIQRGRLYYFLALLDDSNDRVTGLASGRLLNLLKHLLKPCRELSASIDCPAHCKQINFTSGNRNIAHALNVVIQGVFVLCASGMSAESISYAAIEFPAPVCDECRIPMVTITTIFHHLTAHPVKAVSYECQKCRRTLGAPRPRRHRIVLPFPGSTYPA